MQRTKEELLREIRESKEELSEEELIGALRDDTEVKKKDKPRSLLSKEKLISSVAYSIGSLIILTGVFLLSREFWDTMGPFFRVGITFGMGIVIFVLIVFSEMKALGPRILKEPLSILSGILVFLGGLVLLYEVNYSITKPFALLLVSVMTTSMFGSLYLIRKSSIYLLLGIASCSGTLYFALLLDSVKSSLELVMKEPEAVFAYLISMLGISYIFIAHLLKEKRLSTIFYFIGSLATVYPLFFLSYIYSAPAWNVFAVLTIIGLALLAVKIRRPVIALASMILLFTSLSNIFIIEELFILILAIGILFPFTIIAFFLWLIALRKREMGMLPYLIVITASLTVLPYAILSLNFIQDAFDMMKNPESMYIMLTSIIGLSYTITGYLLSEKSELYTRFSKTLYFVGTFVLTVPLFSLVQIYGGFWDIIAILAIIGSISLGVHLQERALIISGGILLTIDIVLVSYRYFANSIGWPITLIIAGFLLIGSGYLSYYLSKRAKGLE